MTRKYEDLTGQTFHCLKVIDPSTIRVAKQGKMWNCECECGNKTVVRADALKSGIAKSCGCIHPCNNTEAKHIAWKGHRGLSGTHWTRIRKNAELRGLQFSITLIDAWNQYEKQEAKCALTGIALSFGFIRNRKYFSETTASLDRINSSKGYTIDNIQWVHKEINRMKGKLSDEDFINFCIKVAELALARQSHG